ncbi:MAG: hypothetical protein BV457_00380 [Thermoplasmata archaeon M9B1D]|nr:MAG: hypothetical protein BV457_00380 [Thermoplasmata archaeon M9B1D]PNX52182.1 MAG: hypothetical protein BV456_00430 [Thermoplasmata archaeon M8B2D]
MENNNEIVFKSVVSSWIAGLYWAILIFLVVMFIGVPLFTPMTFFEKSIFVLVFIIVFLIILYTLFRAYRLSFIISKDRLLITGLLKNHEIMFSDIKDVKKVPIPFGFRLFGASFLGGRFYLPGVGNATVAMSNFDDGVLVSTKKGYTFVITPKNPMEFIDDMKNRVKNEKM